MRPRPFNAHSPGAGGNGLVQYVFRSPARNPPIESSRRGSCAAPLSEKRSSLSRVRTFEISNLKIELNQIRTRQERQSSQLDLLQLLAPSILSERERCHLLNLRQGTTANYGGNHDLRSDLRRLRYLTLITTTQSVHSGAADGTVFDL